MTSQNNNHNSDEISLYDILQIFIKRKFILIAAVIIGLCLGITYYVLFPGYYGNAKLMVKDERASGFMAISNSFVGNTLGMNGKDTFLEKYLARTKTHEFNLKLFDKISKLSNDQNSPDREHAKKTLEYLNSKINDLKSPGDFKHQMAVLIEQEISLEVSTAESLIIASARTIDPFITSLLVNEAIKEIKEILIEEETKQLSFVESQLKVQLDEKLKNVNYYTDKIASFSTKKSLFMMETQLDKQNPYAVELKKKIFETESKIQELEQIFDGISKKYNITRDKMRSISEESTKFGVATKLFEINDEISVYKGRLATLKKQKKSIDRENSTIPQDLLELEQMKKLGDLEFLNYQSIQTQLIKTNLQRITLTNQFEILDSSNEFRIQRTPKLLILLPFCFVISLLIGAFVIYFLEIVKKPSNSTPIITPTDNSDHLRLLG